MSATERGVDPAAAEAPLDRVLSMLAEALAILDAEDVPLELGARLQGIIEELKDHQEA